MVTLFESSKRYMKLLGRLLQIEELRVGAARSVFRQLLRTRFGDFIELGVTLEAQHALQHIATDSEIAAWQKEVFARLREDVELRRTKRGIIGQGVVLDTAFIGPSRKGRASIEFNADLRDLLAMQAYLLTRVVGLDRIRRCDCGSLFVREGKRLFCSERCQKRVYMRRYRNDVGRES